MKPKQSMLVIRREQMEVLEREMLKRYAPDFLDVARQLYPELIEERGETACLMSIRKVIGDAHEAGFEGYAHLQFLALLSLRWGPDLTSVPWIAEVFLDQSVPVNIRLAELHRRADEEAFSGQESFAPGHSERDR